MEFTQQNNDTTAKNICSIYGKEVITYRKIRNGFENFRSENKTLKNEPMLGMGYPFDFDDDILNAILKQNSQQL